MPETSSQDSKSEYETKGKTQLKSLWGNKEHVAWITLMKETQGPLEARRAATGGRMMTKK